MISEASSLIDDVSDVVFFSPENFLEGDSQKSDDPSMNSNSISRAGSFSRGAKLGVAFDPAIGPAPDDGQSKVH